MPAIPYLRERATDYATAMMARFIGFTASTAGRLTDLNVGGGTRSLFESIALRLEHIDGKAIAMVRRLIPSILFEFLGPGDGITTLTGFPKLPAQPATGPVRFTRAVGTSAAITIPAGARLSAPAVGSATRSYVVPIEAVLPAGQASIDVTVECTLPGTIGNASAGTLTLLDTIANVATATNIAPMRGRDVETDEARRIRFAAWFRNLARAQVEGLEVGARTAQLLVAGAVVERVITARALKRPGKRGLVDLFIDNGGGTASADLIALTQQTIDGGFNLDGTPRVGWKAAGDTVVVSAVTVQPVAVTARLRIGPPYRFADIAPVVTESIEAYLAGLGVGVPMVHADLVCVVAQLAGVEDVSFATPTANVVPARGHRLLAGVVTLTEDPLL